MEFVGEPGAPPLDPHDDRPRRRGAGARAAGQRRCRPCESGAHRPRHARVRRVDRARSWRAALPREGAAVVSAGVIPTPAVAYLTRSEGFDAGIVISASHNPYEDNGIKIFSGRGEKLDEALEGGIEAMVADESWKVTPVSRANRATASCRGTTSRTCGSILRRRRPSPGQPHRRRLRQRRHRRRSRPALFERSGLRRHHASGTSRTAATST